MKLLELNPTKNIKPKTTVAGMASSDSRPEPQIKYQAH